MLHLPYEVSLNVNTKEESFHYNEISFNDGKFYCLMVYTTKEE